MGLRKKITAHFRIPSSGHPWLLLPASIMGGTKSSKSRHDIGGTSLACPMEFRSVESSEGGLQSGIPQGKYSTGQAGRAPSWRNCENFVPGEQSNMTSQTLRIGKPLTTDYGHYRAFGRIDNENNSSRTLD